MALSASRFVAVSSACTCGFRMCLNSLSSSRRIGATRRCSSSVNSWTSTAMSPEQRRLQNPTGHTGSSAATTLTDSHRSGIDSLPLLPAYKLRVFDDMILRFNENLTCRDGTIVASAPNLAIQADVDRRNSFLDVLDRWWKQAQLIYQGNHHPFVDIMYDLSQLNLESRGLVKSKLDAVADSSDGVVGFLLKRLVSVGLERLSCDEIARCLRSLANFTTNDKPCSRGNDFWQFIDKLNEYFAVKEITNQDRSDMLMHQRGSIVLMESLRRISAVTTPQLSLADDMLRTLSQVSKEYLDNSGDKTINSGILLQYVNFWFGQHRDPDEYVEGCWRSWFSISSSLFAEWIDRPQTASFALLVYSPSIAKRYIGAMEPFSRAYPKWHAVVDQVLAADRGTAKNAVRVCDMLISLGQLHEAPLAYSFIRRYKQEMTSTFKSLWDLLIASDWSEITPLIMQKTLRNVRCGFYEDAGLSKEFFDRFTPWYQSYARDLVKPNSMSASTSKPSVQALDASDIAQLLYLMRDSRHIPEDLRRDMCQLYYNEISSRSNKNSWASMLWRFGDFCLSANVDPASYPKLRDVFWSTWFRRTQERLEQTSKAGNSRPEILSPLLLTAIRIAVQFRRIEEFRQIQSPWLQRLTEELKRSMYPATAVAIRDALFVLISEHSFIFDRYLMSDLEKLAKRHRVSSAQHSQSAAE